MFIVGLLFLTFFPFNSGTFLHEKCYFKIGSQDFGNKMLQHFQNEIDHIDVK